MHDANHQSRITNHAGYEIRENDMLENKAINSTVGAASAAITGLMLAASLLLAPSAALADNECVPIGVDPSANGATADSYDCDDAAGTGYGSGVTYTADGDLTIDFTDVDDDGALNRTTIGGTGITLTGVGGESITFDSATNVVELQNQSGMTGALLGVTTVNGDIDIDTEEIDGDTFSASGVTHGIFAESTGTGSIFIDTMGPVDAQSGTNPDTSIGIEAIANSGNIILTTGGSVTGNQYGIRAETGGSGTLTIVTNGSVGVDGNVGVAGIDATSGSGLLSIDVNSSVSGNGDSTGIRTEAGGDVGIAIANGGQVNGGIALDLNAAGAITVDNDGAIRGGFGVGEFAMQVTGNSLVLTNTDGPGNLDGLISGAIDFSGLDDDGDGYIFNNNGVWNISPGTIGNNPNPQLVSILGAGTFNNAGTIEFGERESVILAAGTDFTGVQGSSVFEMGVTLSSMAQASCGAPTVAGCLDLSGGSTAGQTEILITSSAPPLDPAGGLTTEANPGILLVDVSGGTSAADHFVLHPDTENYLDTSLYGGVITTGGPLFYALLYNPDTQQHGLSSVPTDEGVTYAAFNQEVLSMWHTTADAVAGRQADLREGAARGGWVRVVSDNSERESTPTLTTHGNTFTYEQDYDLDTTAVMFGSDVHSGDNHIIGLHVGLVRSHLEFEDSSNRDRTKGAAAGVYGGWWRDLGAGQLTLDGTLNANFLRLKHWNSFEVTDSDVRTIGLRAEAGWLLPVVGESFYVQPLATAAYARANIETLELRQNDLEFEDVNSERVALGVRLGGDVGLSGNRFGNLKYWLTARAWEENAEDGSVDYQTIGDPLSIEDDISESFEEIGLGVSLTSPDNDLNVFLSGGLQSGDQTDSTNVTIGARLRW